MHSTKHTHQLANAQNHTLVKYCVNAAFILGLTKLLLRTQEHSEIAELGKYLPQPKNSLRCSRSIGYTLVVNKNENTTLSMPVYPYLAIFSLPTNSPLVMVNYNFHA